MNMPIKRKRARKGTPEELALRDRIKYRRQQYRRMWLLDPYRSDALEAAKVPYKGSDKRRKWQWICSICKEGFKREEVQVDHVIACGSYLKDEDEPGHRERLLNGELQVLCKPCHQKKTNEERKRRGKKNEHT